MISRLRAHAMLLGLVWFGLTACGSPPPDEQQIRDRIGMLVAAIQATRQSGRVENRFPPALPHQ